MGRRAAAHELAAERAAAAHPLDVVRHAVQAPRRGVRGQRETRARAFGPRVRRDDLKTPRRGAAVLAGPTGPGVRAREDPRRRIGIERAVSDQILRRIVDGGDAHVVDHARPRGVEPEDVGRRGGVADAFHQTPVLPVVGVHPRRGVVRRRQAEIDAFQRRSAAIRQNRPRPPVAVGDARHRAPAVVPQLEGISAVAEPA